MGRFTLWLEEVGVLGFSFPAFPGGLEVGGMFHTYKAHLIVKIFDDLFGFFPKEDRIFFREKKKERLGVFIF